MRMRRRRANILDRHASAFAHGLPDLIRPLIRQNLDIEIEDHCGCRFIPQCQGRHPQIHIDPFGLLMLLRAPALHAQYSEADSCNAGRRQLTGNQLLCSLSFVTTDTGSCTTQRSHKSKERFPPSTTTRFSNPLTRDTSVALPVEVKGRIYST